MIRFLALAAVLAGSTVAAGAGPAPGAKAVFFGDSITAGVGASSEANRYPNRIAAKTGWRVVNKGRSGSQLAGEIPDIYGEAVDAGSRYFLLTGYNDMRNFGTDPFGLEAYRGTLYAALAWLAIPDTRKIKASGGGVAYEGAWSASRTPGGFGRSSLQRGAKATFNVSGPVIYLGVTGMFKGSGMFSVAVDGREIGAYYCSIARTPASGLAVAPFLVRIPGFSDGLHTVTITVGSTAGTVYFDWAAGAPGGHYPAVFVGNALRMRTESYRRDAPWWSAGSDEAVSAMNAVIRAASRELAGDGWKVEYVDVSADYDPATADLAADGIHPSDRGMEKIAAAFLRAVEGSKGP